MFRFHGVWIAEGGEARAGPSTQADLNLRFDPELEPGRLEVLRVSGDTGYALCGDRNCAWLCRDRVHFRITRDEIRHGPEPLDAWHRNYLRGKVFALWLHLTGRIPLHGSVLERHGRAIALIGRSGAGKSTLAAALLADGARLLSDDLCVPHLLDGDVRVWPGSGQLRLWPDSARALGHDPERLPQSPTQPGKSLLDVAGEARDWPLAAIVVLQRHDGEDPEPRLSPLPADQALLQVLAQVQLAGPAEWLGLGPQRLQASARLVARVPVGLLRFASGHRYLPAVIRALEGLPRAD